MSKCKKLDEVVQLTGNLIFTNEELEDRVNLYLKNTPSELYHGDIIVNDKYCKSRPGYYTKEGKSFCEVIANVIYCNYKSFKGNYDKFLYEIGCHKKDNLKQAILDANGIYNYITMTNRQEDRMSHCIFAQDECGDFCAVDYQLKLNSSSAKVDLLLKDKDHYYITEVKKFNSQESLLRCILEIQTYYDNLDYLCERNKNLFNKDTIQKAVLIDETSFAYKQLNENWAKKLIDKFNIHILVLSKNEDYVFTIKELK